ncbi:hypothetical protein [Hyphomicrobium sp. CS1GBMeth3]|uniref:hypothetical protein n=1 Tax=Hyphomicrobium sp. CS1GBMeth3 TaxID=1892845 RepID=UPI00092FF7BF|nr:hypothetical protein [Hyphomicrobium sp. CS1GBMeth3]
MPNTKSPEHAFRVEHGKRAISRRFDNDNTDLDPTRQEAPDKNEVPDRIGRAAPSKRQPGALDEEE